MYNILIIEDDKIQRNGLKSMLQQTSSDYNIFTASTAKEGYDICMSKPIDLFILDVVLSDISGLELACNIRRVKKYEFVWIIFITDYTQYIVSAFQKAKCYEYILKPYKKECVVETVAKLLAHKVIQVDNPKDQYLVFKKQGVVFKIYINDIMYIDVFNKVCKIYTRNQTYEIKRVALKDIMKRLPEASFVQCHRSFLVNVGYIDKCKKSEAGWELTLCDNLYKIPLGDLYKEKVFSLLTNRTGCQQVFEG